METCAELSDLLHCEEKSGVGCEAEQKKKKNREWKELGLIIEVKRRFSLPHCSAVINKSLTMLSLLFSPLLPSVIPRLLFHINPSFRCEATKDANPRPL